MAIVTRYFSTAGAGAADGTSWADRAALFSSGNWSSVITGFDFSGTDSLKCLIGPGSYSCAQTLAAALFTQAPRVANPLILHGCDGSGNLLSPPDPDWVSAQAAWDDSSLPVIDITANVAAVNLPFTLLYLLKFTTSTRSGPLLSGSGFTSADWCVVVNSVNNTSSSAVSVSTARISNSVLSCTGAAYAAVVSISTGDMSNCRVVGVTGSSGNRRGVDVNAGNPELRTCTIIGCGGNGFICTSGSTGSNSCLAHCTIANNGGAGVKTQATAAQTGNYYVRHCLITGNGEYGVDAQSAANLIATNNRLRDNTSGPFNGLGNYPIDLHNYTTDSDDATEYVDAANGDYRIKNTAAIWGKGYGVADEPAAGGSGSGYSRGRVVNA